MIELAQNRIIGIEALSPAIIEAIRTDPIDLEVIWNVGVWQNELGHKEQAKSILTFASRLAPGNVLVSRAVESLQPKQ